MQPGCKFKGDYLVVSLSDLRENLEGKGVHIKRVKEIVVPSPEQLLEQPWRFPLAEAKLKQQLEIDTGHRVISASDPPAPLEEEIKEKPELELADASSADPPPMADEPLQDGPDDPPPPVGYLMGHPSIRRRRST